MEMRKTKICSRATIHAYNMVWSGCYTQRLCRLLYTTKTVAKNYIIKSGGSDFQELFKVCEGVRVWIVCE